jgi:hypothetical protein
VFTQIPGFVAIILCFACLELACPQIVAAHDLIPYETVDDELAPISSAPSGPNLSGGTLNSTKTKTATTLYIVV